MGQNTKKPMKHEQNTPEILMIPKRLKRQFTLLIMSYVIVGCAAGLYLVARPLMLGIEFSKYIQYPTAIPFLVNLFVSFFMIYVTLMIKNHLQTERKIYKEDTYLLYCMMATQVLFFNYISFIPTLFVYTSLRKNLFFSKERYPKKSEQNQFIPVMTESVFYYVCFIISGLTIVFALLLLMALLQKH